LIVDEKLFVGELGRENDDIVRTTIVVVESIPVGADQQQQPDRFEGVSRPAGRGAVEGGRRRFHRWFSCWLGNGGLYLTGQSHEGPLLRTSLTKSLTLRLTTVFLFHSSHVSCRLLGHRQ
ncbi:hypothetical protein ACLOJK_018595, partial [Asimina triloba]